MKPQPLTQASPRITASLEPPLHPYSPVKRVFAEALGSALLLAIVIGSGIMAERLSAGNASLALLGNTLAIAAGLIPLIVIFGPVSGAHFNPTVTLAFALRREIGPLLALAYVAAQVVGGILGVFGAHAMFAEPILQVSHHLREGPAQVFSEGVASFGLLATIFGVLRFRPDFTPTAVGLYIFAACWFTGSCCFVNPAVTLARTLSDTFCGIAPSSAPAFIAAQFAGALAAILVFGWLLKEERPR